MRGERDGVCVSLSRVPRAARDGRHGASGACACVTSVPAECVHDKSACVFLDSSCVSGPHPFLRRRGRKAPHAVQHRMILRFAAATQQQQQTTREDFINTSSRGLRHVRGGLAEQKTSASGERGTRAHAVRLG